MGDERGEQGPAGERTGRGDAAHLDEDAEALEDPVHAGEARHQHEQHERERRRQRRDEPGDRPGSQ